MTEALIDYAVFLAKTLTVVIAVGLGALLIARARGRGKPAGGEDAGELEVLSLDDRLDDMSDAIRHVTLPPKAYKKAHKALRKEHKHRAKAAESDKPRLFVLDFHGDIMASEVGALRETISALLTEATPKDEVLLRLENAGGAVHEHGLAASQLLRIRARNIPLTVAVDKVAASGGYLMACVANRIIAAPFAVIGSIGVLAELPNFHRLLESKGIDFELHTAGEHKRTLTLFGENTDEGRAKLREQLEETHALFKAFIREHRASVDVDKVATGEYWHGEQAVALGLVDALQTSDDYLLDARERAELFRLRYQTKKRPLQRLVGAFGRRASGLLAGLAARWA